MLAPDFVARAATSMVTDPAQRWMLQQPARVRSSYVHDVLDKANDARAQQIWMLRQPDAVRAGYATTVLGDNDAAARWMLGQPAAVRESYIREVL